MPSQQPENPCAMKNHQRKASGPAPRSPRRRDQSRSGGVRRSLDHLSLAELQELGFAVITAILNHGRPDTAVPIDAAYGSDDTSWCAEAHMSNLSSGSLATDRAGALDSLGRHTVRALQAEDEGMRLLAPRARSWLCEVTPSSGELKALRKRLAGLGVGSELPLPLVVPRGRKLPSKRTLAIQVLDRCYTLIHQYRENPHRFIEERLYTVPDDAMKVLREEDPALEPWWPQWMSMADALPPLTAETALQWYETIWTMIVAEYRGHPGGMNPDLQAVSRPDEHPFFESQVRLVPLGHRSAFRQREMYVQSLPPLARSRSSLRSVNAAANRVYRQHLPQAIRARLRETWLRLVGRR